MKKPSQDPFAVLFHASPVGMAVTRQHDSLLLEVNEAYCSMLGYTREEVIGHTALDLRIWIHPSERTSFVNLLQKAGRVSGHELTLRAKDGSLRYVEVSAEISEFNGQDCFLSVVVDRTDRKLIQNELEKSLAEARRFREALDHVPAYVYIKDASHRYTYGNRLTLDLFGCTADEIKGADDARFFPPEAAKRLYEIDNRVFSGENTAEEIHVPDTGRGRRVYWEVKAPIHEGDRIWGLVGISTDITQHKELQEILDHQAHTDYLTGLPNRRYFFEIAQKEIARAKRHNESLTIGILDLDFFKVINDTYGHETGDMVLKEFAAICRRTLRESDTIGRLGGEEFGVLWPETNAVHGLEAAERLRTAIEASGLPMEQGLPVRFTVSLGIATLRDQDTNLDVFLNRADQALYHAKHSGRNRVCASETLD